MTQWDNACCQTMRAGCEWLLQFVYLGLVMLQTELAARWRLVMSIHLCFSDLIDPSLLVI